MGTSFSKPLVHRPSYNRDSVVLCDGLNRLENVKYAGTADGRYIFILGSQHNTSHSTEDGDQDLAVSMQLDIIDLFLSKRTRIGHIGDFYNFGHPTGFYALDEKTVVIVDYEQSEASLRQRLIHIDLNAETAECLFYRGYSIAMDLFVHAKTSTGEECAVTVVPALFGRPHSGIVYPLNPLSKQPHKEITLLIDQANAHVRQFYEAGEAGEARVSTFNPPFFISTTVLGFFIDPRNIDDLIDPMKVLVMDITSGSVYLQEAKSTSAFPLSRSKTRPAYCEWGQATNREVALLSHFRRTGRCWQVYVSALILNLVRYTAYAAAFCWTRNWSRLGDLCLRASFRMFIARKNLIEPQTENFTGFGTLNTRTLEWSEIKATVWNEDETSLIPLRGGQFVVASMTNQTSSSRVIGLGVPAHQKMERFRLIGNPLRMTSLSRLSSIAVQKCDRVPSEVLEQIATRMIAC